MEISYIDPTQPLTGGELFERWKLRNQHATTPPHVFNGGAATGRAGLLLDLLCSGIRANPNGAPQTLQREAESRWTLGTANQYSARFIIAGTGLLLAALLISFI